MIEYIDSDTYLQPDDTQANLMRRTAAHIRGSPNPAQLEMRILANHGGDPRFAFLRGRWKRAWTQMRQDQVAAVNVEPKRSVMGGLSAYASDSDDSGSKSDGEDETAHETVQVTTAPPPMSGGDDTEKLKAERRARAKEWTRRRREEQLAHTG